jgi:hypothetical protein
VTVARLFPRVSPAALASALVLTGGAAHAQVQQAQSQPEGRSETRAVSFLDLEAALGWSSNPNSRFNAESSVFGRLSAAGTHEWLTEHGSTAINGYVENTTYFRGGYGSKQLLDLGARTNQAVSETVTVYGSLGFTADFAGQLSNRLVPVPAQPVPVDPNNPLPPTTYYPDVFGLSGRSYHVNGNVGAAIRTGPRGTLSVSAGAQHAWFTSLNKEADFTSYFGSLGYSSQISERTSLGGTVFLQHQDFKQGGSNVVNPMVTMTSQLSESMTANAAAGVIFIDQDRATGGHDHSVTPSFSGSLCNQGETSRFCARVARDAQASLSSSFVGGERESAVSTSVGFDYYHRLPGRATIQASLTGVHYDTPSAINGDKFRTTYLSAVVGYDRPVGSRLYAGVQGGVRKLFQSGPDPKMDFNASVYVRYRIGDLL